MRKLTLFLLLLAAAFSLHAAAADDDVHAAIRRYREALVKKDVKALESIWSDDYVFVNGHGQLRTKADRLADIRSGASTVDSVTHEEEPSAKVHGKTTLVLS